MRTYMGTRMGMHMGFHMDFYEKLNGQIWAQSRIGSYVCLHMGSDSRGGYFKKSKGKYIFYIKCTK